MFRQRKGTPWGSLCDVDTLTGRRSAAYRRLGATGDEKLTTYKLVMQEVELAVSRLARALGGGDSAATDRGCAEAWAVYRTMVKLFPKIQLDPRQRDSLIAQMARLRSQLEECELRTERFSVAGSL